MPITSKYARSTPLKLCLRRWPLQAVFAPDGAQGGARITVADMNYTGEVVPGGPAQERELDDVTITKFSVGAMDNNVYLLSCRHTGRRLLIDAASNAERISEVLGDGELDYVVTTHRHHDHIGATEAVVTRTGATGIAHADDADHIPAVSRRVHNGDTIECGRFRVELIHLVGHTPGSIAVLYRDPGGSAHLFTGDSLFPGGVGKTRTDEDFESLINDVEQRIFDVLDDDTWVYPGHGNDTTLGQQRDQLPQWRERRW